MNHQRHTYLTKEIENLKKTIKPLQDQRDIVIASIEQLEEELDQREIELINLDLEDDEEPTPEEQDEASIQEADDLEASRGQY